jgi:hypothetical protein
LHSVLRAVAFDKAERAGMSKWGNLRRHFGELEAVIIADLKSTSNHNSPPKVRFRGLDRARQMAPPRTRNPRQNAVVNRFGNR